MITRLTSVFLCMIGLVGILFIISSTSPLLGLPMAIVGFIASFSLTNRK